jgi:hypothetical protein
LKIQDKRARQPFIPQYSSKKAKAITDKMQRSEWIKEDNIFVNWKEG